jgi:hypothetical protein
MVEHSLTGFGLKPETTYTWELAGIEGEVTTGAVPSELDTLILEITGAPFGFDGVLMYVSCGYFIMVDTDGDVVWAQESAIYDSLPDGMYWSQASHSVLALEDSTMGRGVSSFNEVNVSGEEVLRLEADEDFTLKLTHDVSRWSDYVYLLGEDEADISGFEIFKGTEHLATWQIDAEFADVPNIDTDHINTLSVNEGGEVVMSVYGFHGVISVDGNPDSPTFLQMNWHASGDPGGDVPDLPDPDYVIEDGLNFRRQHNTNMFDGQLWLFDNSSQPTSRGLVFDLDDSTGQLLLDQEYNLDLACSNQGGVLKVDGGALITCANQNKGHLFPTGGADPVYTIKGSCPMEGPLDKGVRVYPVMFE